MKTYPDVDINELGEVFYMDVSERIFAFLKLRQIPIMLATSKGMRDVAKRRMHELLTEVKSLNYTRKRIEIEGVYSFAEAINNGALRSLRKLWMEGSCIGLKGIEAISPSISSETLPNIEVVDLSNNGIEDSGFITFIRTLDPPQAEPVNIEKLYFKENQIGDEGIGVFASMITAGALESCTLISFSKNNIGDAGMESLATAIIGGALPNLVTLFLQRNPGNTSRLKEVCDHLDIHLYTR